MGLFKSPEERELEARQRAEEEARTAQAAAAAVFAGSPVGRARAATQRGDRFFQVELEVSALTGVDSMFGSSDNEITRREQQPDLLGRIEDEGWHLEHASFVFVETGSTSTDRMVFSGQGTVTRGVLTGIYLFRATPPRPDPSVTAI